MEQKSNVKMGLYGKGCQAEVRIGSGTLQPSAHHQDTQVRQTIRADCSDTKKKGERLVFETRADIGLVYIKFL